MSQEVEFHLRAAEKENDLYTMRTHLAALEREQHSFSVDDWRRYQEIAKVFRERIVKTFAGMGS